MTGYAASLLVLLSVGIGAEARADNAPSEPWAPSGSLSMGAALSTASDADELGGLSSIGSFELRNRNLLGKGLGMCVGFDGSIGGSNQGLAYSAEAYLVGASLRLGSSSYLAACAGAGVGAVGDAIPFAYQLPAELSGEFQAGPLRISAYARARLIRGEDTRREGSSTLSFADDFSAGLALRWGRNQRFWKDTNASYGYFLGASYQELLGSSMMGLSLGVSFWGGN